jgi:hypothetical protein
MGSTSRSFSTFHNASLKLSATSMDKMLTSFMAGKISDKIVLTPGGRYESGFYARKSATRTAKFAMLRASLRVE